MCDCVFAAGVQPDGADREDAGPTPRHQRREPLHG